MIATKENVYAFLSLVCIYLIQHMAKRFYAVVIERHLFRRRLEASRCRRYRRLCDDERAFSAVVHVHETPPSADKPSRTVITGARN